MPQHQFKMYFMLNLAFVNNFDKWTDSIMPIIDLDIIEEEQTLPIALQDLTPNTSKFIDKPTHLRDFFT